MFLNINMPSLSITTDDNVDDGNKNDEMASHNLCYYEHYHFLIFVRFPHLMINIAVYNFNNVL